jgi:hypothetical protein
MEPLPITEDQEWTLRRWASTVGERPRKRDKAFLKAEKGLSEEQIDSWWKNIDIYNPINGECLFLLVRVFIDSRNTQVIKGQQRINLNTHVLPQTTSNSNSMD